jgi:hypothetical protein
MTPRQSGDRDTETINLLYRRRGRWRQFSYRDARCGVRHRDRFGSMASLAIDAMRGGVCRRGIITARFKNRLSQLPLPTLRPFSDTPRWRMAMPNSVQRRHVRVRLSPWHSCRRHFSAPCWRNQTRCATRCAQRGDHLFRRDSRIDSRIAGPARTTIVC